MKAVVYHGVGDIRIDEIPEPELQAPTDGIVRLTSSAICGTDRRLTDGIGVDRVIDAVGVDAEVIDVRSLVPLDMSTIGSSVAKTSRMFTVEENPRLCGWGAEIASIVDAGCYPITMGGNAGPSTYPVLKTIAAKAGGPTAVLNFDAHHDNQRGEWQEDDPKQPRWGSAWARRILRLPGVDPGRYHHFGLRGPRNDPDTFQRFVERGVKREHIYTYREIKQARRAGFDGWAESLARQIVDGSAKVWIAVDPDVLNLGSNPDFGDEPLGPTVEEVVELAYQVGRAAGRERFGGIGFMALPHDAQTLHSICVYILLYTLAGVISSQ